MNNLETRSINGVTEYEIRFIGHLRSDWQDWFEGFSLEKMDDGSTVLTGHVEDQAALQGILVKIRNLGLSLISINPLETSCKPSA